MPIVGDPWWNRERHLFVKPLRWDAQGMAVFGRSSTLSSLEERP
ncbi:hypothetical protein [Janthinobacterium sp. HLX7-2]